MDAQTINTHIMTADPGLTFLWNDRDVDREIQAMLARDGFKDLRLFALLGDNRADIREFLKTSYGVDPSAGTPQEKIAARLKSAKVIDAWEAAKKRAEEKDVLEAQQRASRLPITMDGSEHVMLRMKYHQTHGKLEDRAFPCKALIESRFEQVDEGSYTAESLQDVVSIDENIEDPRGATIDKTGALRLTKTSRKVPLPSSSETMRARIRLLGVSFTLCHFKHSGRNAFKDATPGIWLEHLDYILGDRVMSFEVRFGDITLRPPWTAILEYEHQIRKKVAQEMTYSNASLGDALLATRRDTEHREQFFVAPVMASMMTAGGSNRRNNRERSRSRRGRSQDRGGKAKGRGGGRPEPKGKRDRSRERDDKRPNKEKPKGDTGVWNGEKIHSETPDRKQICFSYNSVKKGCKGSDCSRVHVCRICFKSHPMFEHKKTD